MSHIQGGYVDVFRYDARAFLPVSHHHHPFYVQEWKHPIPPPPPAPLLPPPSSIGVEVGGKKRRKPKATEMKCSVCGDKAPDHIHYGGIACFSCRAFFRRSVPKHHTYFCSTNHSCTVTVATRKNCQFCRYKKCLASGMKPSWVLSEEEKTSRNLVKFIKKKELNNNNNSNSTNTNASNPNTTETKEESSSSCSSSSASSSPGPASPSPNLALFSQEEQRHIDNLTFAQDSTRNFIPMPESVMKEILEMTRDPDRNMSTEGIIELYKVLYSRVTKFATYISAFEELHPEDKKLLLSKNMDSMAILRTVCTFNKDGTGNLSAQLKQTGSALYGNVGSHYIRVKRVFRHPWAKSESHADSFENVFNRLASLGMDEKAAMLLQLVVLFSVLELPVREREKIEKIQEQMTLLLQRYLKHIGGENLVKPLLLISDLRSLANLLA